VRAELAARLAWIAAGLFIAWQARALGIGKLNEPGPGMLACGLGVGIALVAAVGAAKLLIDWRSLATRVTFDYATTARILGLCLVLLVYIAALVPAGFLLSTFVFLLLLLSVFARVDWPRALLVSAIGSGAIYALFRYGLGTQLPAGLLG
jgi:putative tricarboxylic transport membrane protein